MNKITYDFKREPSEYNPRLIWHINFYLNDGHLLSSHYFKTKKEATTYIQNCIREGEAGFPIGGRMSYASYTKREGSL
jgi:hypothetical protein